MKFLVYGTLKKAFGNHRILAAGGATYIGKAVTVGKFVMVGDGVPFVWPHEFGHPLQGELYDIGDVGAMPGAQTLLRLDRLEGHPDMYTRRQHTVRVIEDSNGIKPLPRGAGEEHEGVWIYECGERYGRRAPLPNSERVVRWLNPDGALEWDYTREERRFYNEDAG